MKEKIQALHLERRAAVYLRQSSMKQLVEHRESTARQYALRQRAIALGWPAERIDVIDCDLGLSGSSAENRTGFQGLAKDVAKGAVGAIFALEVSRLARSSADWHRLLDLCGLADVVIVDEQSVYAPRQYDDRLLLGLKGTMSEAEQHWMRLRLQGGMMNKAKRGELKLPAPVGYEWDSEKACLILHPDERVQRAITLIFERFRVDATGYGVVRYFNSNGLEMPARVRDTGEIRWGSARHAFVIDVLRNPIYTGAYVYGRREERRALIGGELHQRHVTWLQPEAWKVCIKGRHASYIGWDEYMENQKKLEANRSNHSKPRQRGAAREGEALLQGLVLCGRCGYRMSSYYRGNRSEAGYRCRSEPRHHGSGSDCWTVSASAIDRAVVERFLEASAPSEIELSLAVAVEAERQATEVLRQWDLRLERARYEARHAEKRYKAVDPENRVVARTLEKEWNDKLTHVEQLESDMRQAKEQAHLELTDDDRRRIRQMSRDLPQVWAAPTTSTTERKNLLRLAIQEITLSPVEVPKRATRIQILWHSGAVEELVIDRPQLFALHPSILRADRPRLLAAAIEKVSALCNSGLTDREIADALNDAGMLSLGQRQWTNIAVERFRGRHGIKHPGDRQTPAQGRGGRRTPTRREV